MNLGLVTVPRFSIYGGLKIMVLIRLNEKSHNTSYWSLIEPIVVMLLLWGNFFGAIWWLLKSIRIFGLACRSQART